MFKIKATDKRSMLHRKYVKDKEDIPFLFEYNGDGTYSAFKENSDGTLDCVNGHINSDIAFGYIKEGLWKIYDGKSK